MTNNETTEQVTSSTPVRGFARRGLLGLMGGAVAAVGLQLAEAKKGKDKGKGRGKGKGKGKGKNKPKVQICHRNGQGFNLISVSQSAVPAHEDHGDVICAVGVCRTGAATGCAADGTCVFALAAVGTTCTSNNVAGTCTAQGECQPI